MCRDNLLFVYFLIYLLHAALCTLHFNKKRPDGAFFIGLWPGFRPAMRKRGSGFECFNPLHSTLCTPINNAPSEALFIGLRSSSRLALVLQCSCLLYVINLCTLHFALWTPIKKAPDGACFIGYPSTSSGHSTLSWQLAQKPVACHEQKKQPERAAFCVEWCRRRDSNSHGQ